MNSLSRAARMPSAASTWALTITQSKLGWRWHCVALARRRRPPALAPRSSWTRIAARYRSSGAASPATPSSLAARRRR
eukprot:2800274-Pyramimonas_sp.AAC.1